MFVGCAADEAGEVVALEGTLHVLTHMTIDAKGGFQVTQHFQPQGVRGVGLTTGAKYQGTGVTKKTFTAKAGETYTYVNNFRIIGQGRGNNDIVHETFHVTVSANGSVTTTVDNFSADCM